MKKIIAILTLVAMGVLAQSCGSSEKCPAYAKANVESISQNS